MTNWFEIKNAQDLLEKARRELRRIKKAKKRRSALDHAMNCAITIFHVRDWLWKQAGSRLTKLPNIKDEETYHQWLKLQPEACPLLICRDLCNGSKHMEIDRYTPDVSSVPVSAADPSKTTNSDGSVRIKLPDNTVLKIVYTDGRRMDAMPILEQAIAAWDAILTRENLP